MKKILAILLVASVGSSSSYVYSMEAEPPAGKEEEQVVGQEDQEEKKAAAPWNVCMLLNELFEGAASGAKKQWGKTGVSRRCIKGQTGKVESWFEGCASDVQTFYGAVLEALKKASEEEKDGKMEADEGAERNQVAELNGIVTELQKTLEATQAALEKKGREKTEGDDRVVALEEKLEGLKKTLQEGWELL